MNRLYLLRHARTQWAEPGARDYDRALAPSGHEDAMRLGAMMAAANQRPDTVLCSGARRARQTWASMAQHLPVKDVRFIDDLYNFDAAGYVEIVRQSGAEHSLLLIGHNPMMEDVATVLSQSGEADAMSAVTNGFPTCGLAVLRFSTPLSQIRPDDGYLEAFITPQ